MLNFFCEVCGKPMPSTYKPDNGSSGFDYKDDPRPAICSADCYDKIMQPEDLPTNGFPIGADKEKVTETELAALNNDDLIDVYHYNNAVSLKLIAEKENASLRAVLGMVKDWVGTFENRDYHEASGGIKFKTETQLKLDELDAILSSTPKVLAVVKGRVNWRTINQGETHFPEVRFNLGIEDGINQGTVVMGIIIQEKS